MAFNYHIPYEPRSRFTLKTGISLLAKLTTVGSYMTGLFKKSIAVTILNATSYVFGRIVDSLSDKEQRAYIAVTKVDAATNALALIGRINIQAPVAPANVRDQIGLESDVCATPAGQASSTVRIIAYLCQTTSTVLNLCINFNKEYEENSAFVWGAAVTGALALVLPQLENHFRKENQDRAKMRIAKIAAIASPDEVKALRQQQPGIEVAIARDLRGRTHQL